MKQGILNYRNGLFFLLLALLAACSQVQSPAPEAVDAAALNQKHSFTRASAYFYDEDECSYSAVGVRATKGSWKSNRGPRGKDAWMYISISRYDHCAESYSYASGYAELANNAFKTNGNLKSATLKTTVDVFDYDTYETFAVQVNLTWRGTGDLWQEKDRHHTKFPNYKSQSRWQWSDRAATVSGSVSRGGVKLTQGMTSYGYLSKSSSHSVTIDKRGPVIESFEAWPQTIFEGQNAYLEWRVTAPEGTRLSIDQGVGDVTGQEDVRVSPTETTTYTLTATHRRQTSTAQVTVYVVPAPENDALEPNNTPDDATAITLDYASTELMILPGDVDWFTFALSTAATVTVDIDARDLGSSLDSVIGLFDAGLNELAVNDDHDGLDSYLELTLTPGTYYLAVSSFADFNFSGEHNRVGFYYLNVSRVP